MLWFFAGTSPAGLSPAIPGSECRGCTISPPARYGTRQVTREATEPGAASVTTAEKAALIKGASELLLKVLNKPLDSTFVIIEEIDMDNWGQGGLPVAEFRRLRRTKAG